MARLLIQGADTLLEGQQALVDLCPFQSRLLIVFIGIRAPLASCKVDEADLAHNDAPHFPGSA